MLAGDIMIPKYLEIYNDILQKIDNQELKVNDKIPSESAMMDQYQASRDTIRKALNLLNQNGYILKGQGKQSIVLDVHKYRFPVSGITSFKELSVTLGDHIMTQVVKCRCVQPSMDVTRKLNLSPKDKVWEIVRVRHIDGERIILDIDYLNTSIIPFMSEEIAQNSLYEYIESDMKLKIGFAKKEIKVTHIDRQDSSLLDLHDYNMVAVVESYTFLDNAQLFQYTMSRHRPDKFLFVDFARRMRLFENE